jgi:uncharacterized protein
MRPSIAQIFGDAPDTRGLRIVPLDGIRGIAVMGILVMNILAFAMPFPAYINPLSYGGSTGADFWAWLIAFIAVDGKMRGLFSLLFGASMWLVIDSAEAKGESGAATHYWRMVFLLIFGLIHCYLIWMGDILALYALCGMIAYFFIRWQPRALITTALVMFGIQFLLWAVGGASIHALEFAAAQPNAAADVVQAYKEMAPALMGPDAPSIAEELKAFTGSYGDALALRTEGEYAFGPLAMFVQFGLETIALMLVGAALLKNGLLAGDWDRSRANALALKFAIPALIGLGISAYLIIASGFATVPTFTISFIWTMPLDWMLTIAYAAWLINWIKPRVGGALVGRLAAAGKAAFTNYLGTSIIMTTLFYGYGFGLFGTLGRAQCYLVVLVMCAVMLLWSKPWLDRFQYGPLEWLWRSLSRRSLQPMQKI